MIGARAPAAAALAVFVTQGFATPATAAISSEEQRVLDALSADRTFADMQRIAGSADGIPQGVGQGSVVAGNPEEAALAADIARRFRELGLAVRSEAFPVREYRYTVPRLEVDGKPVPAISLHAAGAVSGRRDGVAFARGNEERGTRLRLLALSLVRAASSPRQTPTLTAVADFARERFDADAARLPGVDFGGLRAAPAEFRAAAARVESADVGACRANRPTGS